MSYSIINSLLAVYYIPVNARLFLRTPKYPN